MELVWPSAGRAWQLLDGAKDDLDFSSTFASEVRPKKRSADESFDIANLEEAVSQLERVTAGRHPHDFGAPPASNGHAYGNAAIDIDSPLAYFSSYDRWSADSTFGIPLGLSTSVLPQQYSTGFLDERLAHNIHRYGDVVNSNGRYPHIASDYSLGQTSSMLGSMYGMHPLPHSMTQLAPHPHPPNPQHPQAHMQGSSAIYLNDQYDIFSKFFSFRSVSAIDIDQSLVIRSSPSAMIARKKLLQYTLYYYALVYPGTYLFFSFMSMLSYNFFSCLIGGSAFVSDSLLWNSKNKSNIIKHHDPMVIFNGKTAS